MTLQSKKQVQNQAQDGRSMVEMLGVLAIIAVLSIGGIVGYKLAMNHYQASQIAHEMNIMRTDAQIKIAQGTEKLTLGSPYDSGNIQFNDYGTVFDCLDMETETSAPDKVVSCAVANAYYIELKEISEGICKPLANLIDNMDNEIAFYINGKSVDTEAEGEKGACGEGNNTLKVIFGADSNSNAVKCDTVAECELLENTPFCDTDRHVCVECLQKEDCTQGDGGICIENKCDYCADGEVRDESSQCVECTTNDDCENPTPICNSATNTCEPCENDSQCDTAQNEHCTFAGECVVCDANKEAWNDEFKECVVTLCQENSDCNINGKTGFYCYLDFGYSCEQEFNSTKGFGVGKDGYKSSCRKAEKDAREGETSHYVISTVGMDWWSAWRFCDALGRKHATRESINCGSKVDGNFFCTSDIMNKLVADFSRAGWLDKDEGTCRVYAPSFDYGNVFPYSPEKHAIGSGQALCQPK